MEREISIILKVKGAAQAKKAVEDVFSNEVLKKMGNFNVGLKKTGDGMQRVGRTSKQASTGVISFNKALGRGLSILYLYNRAWSTFGSQFEEGLQLERASDQFSRNVGNVNKMLPELRSATRGVVADFDLLRTAGRAFQQGLSGNRLAETFKMATIASQKLGMSATDTINTITQAITRQDEGALNTLGIISKTDQAYLQQIAILHKHGGVQARALAVQMRADFIMSRLRQNFGGMNSVQEDGLMVLDRLRASWKNFRAELGQTLGHALVPMAKALTVVLDQMTRLLDKMNQTQGFRTFVQLSATLATIWGTAKFITGAKTLMNLFGILQSGKMGKGGIFEAITSGKFKTRATSSFGIMGKKLKEVGSAAKDNIKYFQGVAEAHGKLSATKAVWIEMWGAVAPAIKSVMKFGIWGTIIASSIGPIAKMFSFAYKAAKVFFQLLSNYDEETGLSKVLKEDAEALGGFYNAIENIAKYSLYVGAALKGIFKGIGEAFAPVGWAVDKVWQGLQFVAEKFGFVNKEGLVLKSTLRDIEWWFSKIAKYLTAGIGGFALGGPIGALLGVATAGLTEVDWKNMDAIQKFTAQKGMPITDLGPRQRTPTPNVGFGWEKAPQASTQVSSPTARPQNLDYGTETPPWADKMIKELMGQTAIMENDAQKQEIEKSQNQARNNIWTRR